MVEKDYTLEDANFLAMFAESDPKFKMHPEPTYIYASDKIFEWGSSEEDENKKKFGIVQFIDVQGQIFLPVQISKPVLNNEDKDHPYYWKDEDVIDIISKENDVSKCYCFGKRPVKEYHEDEEDPNDNPNRQFFLVCHDDKTKLDTLKKTCQSHYYKYMTTAPINETPNFPNNLKISQITFDRSDQMWESKEYMFLDNRFACFKHGKTDIERGIWYYKIDKCKANKVGADYDGLPQEIEGDHGLPKPPCCFSFLQNWTKAHKTLTYICSEKEIMDECIVEKDKVQAKLLGECHRQLQEMGEDIPDEPNDEDEPVEKDLDDLKDDLNKELEDKKKEADELIEKLLDPEPEEKEPELGDLEKLEDEEEPPEPDLKKLEEPEEKDLDALKEDQEDIEKKLDELKALAEKKEAGEDISKELEKVKEDEPELKKAEEPEPELKKEEEPELKKEEEPELKKEEDPELKKEEEPEIKKAEPTGDIKPTPNSDGSIAVTDPISGDKCASMSPEEYEAASAEGPAALKAAIEKCNQVEPELGPETPPVDGEEEMEAKKEEEEKEEEKKEEEKEEEEKDAEMAKDLKEKLDKIPFPGEGPTEAAKEAEKAKEEEEAEKEEEEKGEEEGEEEAKKDEEGEEEAKKEEEGEEEAKKEEEGEEEGKKEEESEEEKLEEAIDEADEAAQEASDELAADTEEAKEAAKEESKEEAKAEAKQESKGEAVRADAEAAKAEATAKSAEMKSESKSESVAVVHSPSHQDQSKSSESSISVTSESKSVVINNSSPPADDGDDDTQDSDKKADEDEEEDPVAKPGAPGKSKPQQTKGLPPQQFGPPEPAYEDPDSPQGKKLNQEMSNLNNEDDD